jgi:undecaprenyl-phosphate 4-deoxy-4-formamido-L-arabinose transferase
LGTIAETCWGTDRLSRETPCAAVEFSVIVPIHDKETILETLFERLYPVLDGTDLSYEVVFVDNGSRDRSPTLLRQQHKLRPDVTRVVLLRSAGDQQMAFAVGFDASVGKRILTLDASLRTPPEWIRHLLAEMDRGHDYVGGIRRRRQDIAWRARISEVTNRARERLTGIRVTDLGCALRAYDRGLLEAVLASDTSRGFIPARAWLYSADPTEIEVDYENPRGGESGYALYQLIERNLSVLTAYSLLPLKAASLLSIGGSLIAFWSAFYLGVRRLVLGPDAEGVTLPFGILLFLAGILLFVAGLFGQYLAHLHEDGRGRPRHLVREHLHPTPRRGSSNG